MNETGVVTFVYCRSRPKEPAQDWRSPRLRLLVRAFLHAHVTRSFVLIGNETMPLLQHRSSSSYMVVTSSAFHYINLPSVPILFCQEQFSFCEWPLDTSRHICF